MQSLFEEKLASQKEALLQGKQLADIIELQNPDASDEMNRLSQSVLSAPAASRTLTEIQTRRKRRSVAIGAVVLGAAVGVAAGAAWVLRPRPAASPAAESVAPKGSILVTSDPRGAAIWVNGDLRPEVTPATLSDLPTGRPLDVKLTKDGFERASEQVTLTEAQPNGNVALTLKRGSVAIDVGCKQGAADCPSWTLSLDGTAYPGTSIDGVTSGEPHKLVVSVPGAADQTFTFTGSPYEKKHFDVTLDHVAGDAVNAPSSPPATHRPHSSPPSASPAPQPAAGNGKLNVGAAGGWCNVTVDGAARGATPVAGIELGSGPHRITCATSDGKTQVATVTVTADATTRYRFTIAP
jgi:serine/threonine-protein kinase